MKSVAIIAEYNPFHNGHRYHAREAKARADADVSIAIISGQFVLRGEPAIYNKFIRTQMALSEVDLVVELPTYAALSGGEFFATAGVQLASYFDANALAFGAESNDLLSFQRLAQALNKGNYQQLFKEKLKQGKSYPRILNELFPNETLLNYPNNILGLSYIRAIEHLKTPIDPIVIERHTSQHHEQTIQNRNFASGSSIRSSLTSGETTWQDVVPASLHHLYETPKIDKDACSPYIQHSILTHSTDALKQIYTMSEGLEYRIKRLCRGGQTFEAMVQALKTKRYTYTHLQRVLMNILLNLTQDEVQSSSVTAARVLGMTPQGQKYLKYLKASYPERQYVTNINQTNRMHFSTEIRATQIYNLISGDQANDFNTPVIRVER